MLPPFMTAMTAMTALSLRSLYPPLLTIFLKDISVISVIFTQTHCSTLDLRTHHVSFIRHLSVIDCHPQDKNRSPANTRGKSLLGILESGVAAFIRTTPWS